MEVRLVHFRKLGDSLEASPAIFDRRLQMPTARPEEEVALGQRGQGF